MLTIQNIIIKKGHITVWNEGHHMFNGCNFRKCTIYIKGEFERSIFNYCRFLDCQLEIENMAALSSCFIMDDFYMIPQTDSLKIKRLYSEWWTKAADAYTEALIGLYDSAIFGIFVTTPNSIKIEGNTFINP
ncbi:MAG: hypothetical protein JRD68_00155 [Deltaproteobacteria bacterium]|nr:hypothetical protein [Deltaproteobacteria bacterium]